MNHYNIADLSVAIEGLGEALQKKLKPYGANTQERATMTLSINRESLSKAGANYPHLRPDEWEYIQTGFAFANKLLDFEGFCLHSSAVALENRAVLFSGPCGTGKSTHAKLWQQYFGPDRAIIINDDKPALRLRKGIFYAYGTPWSGKSALNVNMRVPLGAIVFLNQAQENHIRRLDSKEAVQMLIYQSLRPRDSSKMNKFLILLDVLLNNKLPVYQMNCTISPEAVKLAYNTISHERMG